MAVQTAPRTVAAPPVRTRRAVPVRVAGLLGAVALLVLAIVRSIAVGSRSIPAGDVWRLLWANDGSTEWSIVHELRMPRTVLGLLVGAALGLSGVVMQALTRNALAEPGLLGVNLGASTGVVLAIAFLGVTTVSGYVWFAFAGAALTSVAVFVLGSTGRVPSPDRQVLAGIAITAVLGAVISAVLVVDRDAFDQFRFWDVGSFAQRDAGTAWRIAPFVAAGGLVALGLGRALNALALGEDTGRALGAHVRRTQVLGMLAVTLLCGAATAAVGPIWFVGLAVPHIARLVTGPDNRWVLLLSMLLAPALLLGADVLGRVVVAPSELSVGIVTAFLGAPVFLFLVRRRRVSGL